MPLRRGSHARAKGGGRTRRKRRKRRGTRTRRKREGEQGKEGQRKGQEENPSQWRRRLTGEAWKGPALPNTVSLISCSSPRKPAGPHSSRPQTQPRAASAPLPPTVAPGPPNSPHTTKEAPLSRADPKQQGRPDDFLQGTTGPARHSLHSSGPLHEADASSSMRKTEGGPTGETRKQKWPPQQAGPRENGRAERPLLPGAGDRGNPVLLPWQRRGKETLASPGPPSNTKHTDVVIRTLLQDDLPEVVGTTPRVSAREHWLLRSTELSGQVGDLEPSHLTLVSSATAKRGHTKALQGYGEGWHDHLAQSSPLVHWHHL